ncbi:glycosyltransferase [Paenibacillus sp. y28]|uniref:glycosyltransferase n=1 Tax=Paenibacillus sp. y28 TaxID=3129110 RepID=UPI003019877B
MGIAIISSYPPRRCGIAEFTYDLRHAILSSGESEVPIIALTRDKADNYGSEVVFSVQQDRLEDYIQAAEFINRAPNIQAVSLQHEFGLFGGIFGNYIVELLSRLRKPVYTTFHTVINDPPEALSQTAIAIGNYSRRVITLSQSGIRFLQSTYNMPESKLVHIPLGVAAASEEQQQATVKQKLGLANYTVAVTFGLISPNKGIETVLNSLPEVIKHSPQFMYYILGATHPEERRHHGEDYRNQLIEIVQTHGLENNVRFIPYFLSNEELLEYIMACDIYITPYLYKEQISSATLTLAAHQGKALLSSPYYYAEELLSDGCGMLFPFHDVPALTKQLNELIRNDDLRNQLGQAVKNKTASYTWPQVGRTYYEMIINDNLHDYQALLDSLNPQPALSSPAPPLQAARLSRRLRRRARLKRRRGWRRRKRVARDGIRVLAGKRRKAAKLAGSRRASKLRVRPGKISGRLRKARKISGLRRSARARKAGVAV